MGILVSLLVVIIIWGARNVSGCNLQPCLLSIQLLFSPTTVALPSDPLPDWQPLETRSQDLLTKVQESRQRSCLEKRRGGRWQTLHVDGGSPSRPPQDVGLVRAYAQEPRPLRCNVAWAPLWCGSSPQMVWEQPGTRSPSGITLVLSSVTFIWHQPTQRQLWETAR